MKFFPKFLFLIFFGLPCGFLLPDISNYSTLPDSWPIEAEFTPVLLASMDMYKYSYMGYLGGVLSFKLPVFHNLETWVNSHTTLFRQYALSLENFMFGFLNADGYDQFQKGSLLIQFMTMIDDLAAQELADCQTSCAALGQTIASAKADFAGDQATLAQKNCDFVDALLLEASGGTPAEASASIAQDINALVADMLADQATIATQILLQSCAMSKGVDVAWITAEQQAWHSQKTSDELALEASLEANAADQQSLVLQLSNNQSAQDYLNSISGQQVYTQDVYDTVLQSLTDAQSTLNAALLADRIARDETLLGGVYDPSNYADLTPSSFTPVQEKYVSFCAFKQAWDAMNFPVSTVDDLNSALSNFL